MRTRTFTVFVALFLVISVVGCTGDTGPAGPAGATGSTGATGNDGQDGDSVVLAFGAIDGKTNPPTLELSWPGAVTVVITDAATGIWDVRLDGTFPSTQGVIIASNADTSTDATLTAFVATWSTTRIVFRVVAWATLTEVFGDYEFTYLVLGQ